MDVRRSINFSLLKHLLEKAIDYKMVKYSGSYEIYSIPNINLEINMNREQIYYRSAFKSFALLDNKQWKKDIDPGLILSFDNFINCEIPKKIEEDRIKDINKINYAYNMELNKNNKEKDNKDSKSNNLTTNVIQGTTTTVFCSLIIRSIILSSVILPIKILFITISIIFSIIIIELFSVFISCKSDYKDKTNSINDSKDDISIPECKEIKMIQNKLLNLIKDKFTSGITYEKYLCIINKSISNYISNLQNILNISKNLEYMNEQINDDQCDIKDWINNIIEKDMTTKEKLLSDNRNIKNEMIKVSILLSRMDITSSESNNDIVNCLQSLTTLTNSFYGDK